MWKTKILNSPTGFNFRLTAQSHGWYDLPPFRFDDAENRLECVFRDIQSGRSIGGNIVEAANGVKISLESAVRNSSGIEDQVRHILRFDDTIEDFYRAVDGHDRLHWVSKTGAGRLLRSPTVFEDLVKTLCTTNCSWALTKNMVTNIVETLGERTSNGVAAFPAAEAMALQNEGFYRNTIRAGYRSPYFVELAESVATGKIDPEAWLNSGLPTAELKKEIKAIKGIGDYAAENLLKLLGRYDGLALDSWLRGQFYKKINRGKVCPDKKIEKAYSRFGEWKGLAIWCDMTADWHAE
ncbi:MAG: DNA-3-methyladenine glycosylase family protein [Pyrinomonadaceae bacterium]